MLFCSVYILFSVLSYRRGLFFLNANFNSFTLITVTDTLNLIWFFSMYYHWSFIYTSFLILKENGFPKCVSQDISSTLKFFYSTKYIWENLFLMNIVKTLMNPWNLKLMPREAINSFAQAFQPTPLPSSKSQTAMNKIKQMTKNILEIENIINGILKVSRKTGRKKWIEIDRIYNSLATQRITGNTPDKATRMQEQRRIWEIVG